MPVTSQGELLVFATLEDLKTEAQEENWLDGEEYSGPALQGLENFRSMVATAAELGQEHVIWRDI